MKKLLLLSLFAIILFSSCKKNKIQEVTPEEICMDIQNIQMYMDFSILKDIYDPAPFEQLKEEVMAGKVDKVECIYRLKEIICSYHIGHLRLSVLSDNYDFVSEFLPVNFMVFGPDIHIISATDKYEKYLGAKLMEFGGLSVDDAIDTLSKYFSYETASAKKMLIEYSLTAGTLKRCGLTEKNGNLKIKVQTRDGAIKEISLKPVNLKNARFKFLYPEVENPVLTIQDRSVEYGVKASKENATVYMHFNRVFSNVDYFPRDLFSDFMAELDSYPYKNIVFDLRNNGGGEGGIVIMLSHFLNTNKEKLNNYNIAIITSGKTASAACWFINELLRIFPKAVIFGEETGQAIFNYTHVPAQNPLKYIQCDFQFPQSIDDHVDELKKRAMEVTHSDILCGTMPDVYVYETFEGYMNGKDSIYKAIDEYKF